jgi:hypothetical protein
MRRFDVAVRIEWLPPRQSQFEVAAGVLNRNVLKR